MIEWVYSTKADTTYKGRIIHLGIIFYQSNIKLLLQSNNITKGLLIIFQWKWSLNTIYRTQNDIIQENHPSRKKYNYEQIK